MRAPTLVLAALAALSAAGCRSTTSSADDPSYFPPFEDYQGVPSEEEAATLARDEIAPADAEAALGRISEEIANDPGAASFERAIGNGN
jgi:hypothetical protein